MPRLQLGAKGAPRLARTMPGLGGLFGAGFGVRLLLRGPWLRAASTSEPAAFAAAAAATSPRRLASAVSYALREAQQDLHTRGVERLARRNPVTRSKAILSYV